MRVPSLFLRALLIASLPLASGCSSFSRRKALKPEARAAVKKVGVKVVYYQKKKGVKFQRPVTGFGSGFTRGGSMGFRAFGGGIWLSKGVSRAADIASFGTGLASIAYYGLVLFGGVGALLGGLVGGPAGLFKRVPRKDVDAAEYTLRLAYSDVVRPEAAAGALLGAGEAYPNIRFTPYRDGAAFDAVLVYTLKALGLEGDRRFNPDLMPTVDVIGVLETQPDEGKPKKLAHSKVRQADKSKARKFVEWASGDAKVFRREMRTAYFQAAVRVLEDIFGPPPR